MWQAEHVRFALHKLYPSCDVKILGMTTRGDQILDRTLSKVGGKGLFVKEPKDIRKALDEAMAFPGPALVNIVLSQGSARKPQQFRWHS